MTMKRSLSLRHGLSLPPLDDRVSAHDTAWPWRTDGTRGMSRSPGASMARGARLLERAKDVRDGNTASTLVMLREVRDEIESLGPSVTLADCLLQIGNCYALDGKYDEALEYYGRGKAMYTGLGEPAGVGRGLRGEAIVYRSLSLYHLAADRLFASLACLEDRGVPAEVGRTLQNLSVIFSELGFVAEAIDFSHRALDAFETAGDRDTALFSLNDLVLARSRQLRDPAQFDLREGDTGAAALALADAAIARAPRAPPTRITCSLHASRAELLLALERPAEALESLATAQSLAALLRIPLTRARVTALVAEANWKIGAAGPAFDAAMEAASGFEALGHRTKRAEALALASEIAASQAQWDKALELFRAADGAGEAVFQERQQHALWGAAVPAATARGADAAWHGAPSTGARTESLKP